MKERKKKLKTIKNKEKKDQKLKEINKKKQN